MTKKRRLDMLERVVFPSIGKLPVRQITPAHILDILNKTVKRGAPTVAAEAKRTMSGVFEHAVATLRADTDPVWPVRKALPPSKTQHKRALSVEEIGQLLNDFDGHGGNFQTIKAFQMMWLTLSRPNESVQAEWAEFDFDKALWTIPARRMNLLSQEISIGAVFQTSCAKVMSSVWRFSTDAAFHSGKASSLVLIREMDVFCPTSVSATRLRVR